MTAAPFVGLAVALAAASALLAGAHLARVRTEVDGAALAATLKRVPVEERAAEASRRAPAGSWERALAEDVAASPEGPGLIAAVNDALADLEHRLVATAGWPDAALRLSIFGALLIAVATFLAGHREAILLVVGAGAVGAVASAELARRGRAVVARRKLAADALVAALVPGGAGPREPVRPGRVRRRSR